MLEGTIDATQIWKRFRLDKRPTYLQDAFGRAVDRVRGRSGDSWRWVVRDVDFRAEPGESWALLGANGAGKSTLLKLLVGVMYPTAGRVAVKGRVGALIEIRAGISNLLTGRENIYLMGSLMGLRRKEVTRRFDDIVAFAELEQAVDRQVKYYSSGMQMRLGFGVAAFLEPDVLLVDEVLAVGDATFQQRCLDRMREVMAQGTTLVFVSHDLGAVEATCTNGVWMHNGEIVSSGPIREVLGDYRASVEATAEARPRLEGLMKVRDAAATSPDGGVVQTGGPLDVDLTVQTEHRYRSWFYVGVSQGEASPIFLLNPGRETIFEPGETHVRCTIPRVPLPRGRYYVWAAAFRHWDQGSELIGWQPVATFDVFGPNLDRAPRAVVRLAPIHVDSDWEIGPQ